MMGKASSSSGSATNTTKDSEEVKRLAYTVLRVFHRLILSGNDGMSKHSILTNRQLQSISESKTYNAFPEY
jgi:hypothetical protein